MQNGADIDLRGDGWMIFSTLSRVLAMWGGASQRAVLEQASTPTDSIHIFLKIADADLWREFGGGFADYSL
eukprot:1192909-Pyramimonas_sp.AAC.1